jgi:hypothetical protein
VLCKASKFEALAQPGLPGPENSVTLEANKTLMVFLQAFLWSPSAAPHPLAAAQKPQPPGLHPLL